MAASSGKGRVRGGGDFSGQEGCSHTIILTFHYLNHPNTMLLSTNQYKLHVTFPRIIIYSLTLVHLLPCRNKLNTTITLPNPGA
jgi:hypothetical protein